MHQKANYRKRVGSHRPRARIASASLYDISVWPVELKEAKIFPTLIAHLSHQQDAHQFHTVDDTCTATNGAEKCVMNFGDRGDADAATSNGARIRKA